MEGTLQHGLFPGSRGIFKLSTGSEEGTPTLPCLTQDTPRSQVSESIINDDAQWSFSDNSLEILGGMGQLLRDQPSGWKEPPEVLPTNEQNEEPPPCSQWSILSENVTYSTAGSSSLIITPLDQAPFEPESSEPPPQLRKSDLDPFPLECFEGVKASLEPIAHHRSSDVGSTYIGVAEDTSLWPKFEMNQEFSFDPQAYAKGVLPNGKDFHILINSYFSKDFYDNNPDLHTLPKYKSRGGHIYMGNGEWVPCLFVIPLTSRIDNQASEVFTIVCKMANSDFVWGMKEIIETEGILCTRSMKYKFLNRSPKLYLVKPFILPADNSHHIVELWVDFPQEISGHAILKLLLVPGQVLFPVKAPVTRNKISLEISNNTKTKITGSPSQSVGILDVRSIGYFYICLDLMKKTFL